MQKNLYFRQVTRRQNLLGKFILDIFFAFSFWPKLLLEVFIRKNMGDGISPGFGYHCCYRPPVFPVCSR